MLKISLLKAISLIDRRAYKKPKVRARLLLKQSYWLGKKIFFHVEQNFQID